MNNTVNSKRVEIQKCNSEDIIKLKNSFSDLIITKVEGKDNLCFVTNISNGDYDIPVSTQGYKAQDKNLCMQYRKPVFDVGLVFCNDPANEKILASNPDAYIEPAGKDMCRIRYHSIDALEYTIPDLKRCKEGQDPGYYYQNCCPAKEYDELVEILTQQDSELTEIKKQIQLLESESNMKKQTNDNVFVIGFVIILVLIALIIYFARKKR